MGERGVPLLFARRKRRGIFAQEKRKREVNTLYWGPEKERNIKILKKEGTVLIYNKLWERKGTSGSYIFMKGGRKSGGSIFPIALEEEGEKGLLSFGEAALQGGKGGKCGAAFIWYSNGKTKESVNILAPALGKGGRQIKIFTGKGGPVQKRKRIRFLPIWKGGKESSTTTTI